MTRTFVTALLIVLTLPSIALADGPSGVGTTVTYDTEVTTNDETEVSVPALTVGESRANGDGSKTITVPKQTTLYRAQYALYPDINGVTRRGDRPTSITLQVGCYTIQDTRLGRQHVYAWTTEQSAEVPEEGTDPTQVGVNVDGKNVCEGGFIEFIVTVKTESGEEYVMQEAVRASDFRDGEQEAFID